VQNSGKKRLRSVNKHIWKQSIKYDDLHIALSYLKKGRLYDQSLILQVRIISLTSLNRTQIILDLVGLMKKRGQSFMNFWFFRLACPQRPIYGSRSPNFWLRSGEVKENWFSCFWTTVLVEVHRRVSVSKLASLAEQIISMRIVIGDIALIMTNCLSADILCVCSWGQYIKGFKGE